MDWALSLFANYGGRSATWWSCCGWHGIYPTFIITAATTWWVFDGLKIPESVVEHEFGHQYWYGLVATNEFEQAWLDEGINQYTECKVMDALYGRDVDVLNTRVASAGERGTA